MWKYGSFSTSDFLRQKHWRNQLKISEKHIFKQKNNLCIFYLRLRFFRISRRELRLKDCNPVARVEPVPSTAPGYLRSVRNHLQAAVAAFSIEFGLLRSRSTVPWQA